MTGMRRAWLSALVGVLLAVPAAAQPEAAVRGTVVDARTGAPVADVAVSAGGRRTGTDDAGGFRLCRLPAGAQTVVGDGPRHLPGVVHVTVAAGDSAAVTLRLEPDTARPASILLDRHSAPARLYPPPLFILDGERVFMMTSGCETPTPGIRVIEDLPADDITEIQVFRDEEAVARYGPEARNGVVIITTRRNATP